MLLFIKFAFLFSLVIAFLWSLWKTVYRYDTVVAYIYDTEGGRLRQKIVKGRFWRKPTNDEIQREIESITRIKNTAFTPIATIKTRPQRRRGDHL